MLGYEAEQQLCFEMMMRVVPADASRQQAYVTGILDDKLGGNERGPVLSPLLDPEIITAECWDSFLMHIDGISSMGNHRAHACTQANNQ